MSSTQFSGSALRLLALPEEISGWAWHLAGNTHGTREKARRQTYG